VQEPVVASPFRFWQFPVSVSHTNTRLLSQKP
jgi:hypothetical protein